MRVLDAEQLRLEQSLVHFGVLIRVGLRIVLTYTAIRCSSSLQVTELARLLSR